MEMQILGQLLALSLYAFFVGFTFCDGFKLHIFGKLLWFAAFAGISIYTFKARGVFDLPLILSVSSTLAFLFCIQQKVKFAKPKT